MTEMWVEKFQDQEEFQDQEIMSRSTITVHLIADTLKPLRIVSKSDTK